MKIIAAALMALFGAQDPEIDWKKDYKETLKSAKDRGLLVVVHFWADW